MTESRSESRPLRRRLIARLKRSLMYGLGMFVVLISILSLRAAAMSSRQPSVARLEDAKVDAARAAEHLAAALRTRTVSESVDVPASDASLDELASYLEATYPKTYASLGHEKVGEHSLLFTWKGTSSDPPIVLCAHQDVVPVEHGTEATWEHPPFDGVIDGTFVWGRGALDDKGSLIAILEAVEELSLEGFVPKRTVHLAFGQDEEISGLAGASKIVELLATRGVKPEAVLDEGNPLVQGIVPSIDGPVAPIGIAEKGYLTLKLSVTMEGGHSSTPRVESALGVLNAAVERLRARPMPARIDGATAQFFEWTAPEMSFGQRIVLGNMWLTWPVVSRVFAKSPALDASIRTTTAVTIFRSGVKDNVVPESAEAQVNFRLLPGDTIDAVVAHARSSLDDSRVTITPIDATKKEPSRVSSVESRAFKAIATTVREVFPSALVAPGLFLGATDGRKYEAIAADVYRFQPVLLEPADLKRLHGTNERVRIAALADAIRFYRRFIRVMAS